MDLRYHIRLALVYLLIISLLGVTLRHFLISDISIDYKFTLHAHSHVAFLGWVYTALITLIYSLFLSDKGIDRPYRHLFWFSQAVIIGMLITFTISGYSIVSIVFSTLFLFASYRFLFLFLKHTSVEQKNLTSYKWIRASLWFMVISSLGPWALGVIMNTLGSGSEWYRNAIYFYLHFQYNGWFIMAIFGLFFKILEEQRAIQQRMMNPTAYHFFVIGVLLTFFLSLLWMSPHGSLYVISGIGAFLQLIACIMILRDIIVDKREIVTGLSKMTRLLLKIGAVLFALKLIAQVMGAFPQFANVISANKDLIIGYLHWIFLGVVTIPIFAFGSHKGLMKISKSSFYIFFLAFLFMEGLLFYKAIIIWSNASLNINFYTMLFVSSVILSISIGYLLFQQKKLK